MREAQVGNGPFLINELARCLVRHYKNVNSGVTRLIERGWIERGLIESG